MWASRSTSSNLLTRFIGSVTTRSCRNPSKDSLFLSAHLRYSHSRSNVEKRKHTNTAFKTAQQQHNIFSVFLCRSSQIQIWKAVSLFFFLTLSLTLSPHYINHSFLMHSNKLSNIKTTSQYKTPQARIHFQLTLFVFCYHYLF